MFIVFLGSVHDSRILQNTPLATRFNNGWRPFPRAILLGDSGYAVSDWLITPLTITHNVAEERFNRHHKRMRCIIVESCNGLLKERFRCLNFLHFEPKVAANIVKACVTLHNCVLSMRAEVLNMNIEDRNDAHQLLQPQVVHHKTQDAMNLFCILQYKHGYFNVPLLCLQSVCLIQISYTTVSY